MTRNPFSKREHLRYRKRRCQNRNHLSKLLCERLEHRLLLAADFAANDSLLDAPPFEPGQLIIGLNQESETSPGDVLRFIRESDRLPSPIAGPADSIDWDWSGQSNDRMLVSLAPNTNIPLLASDVGQLDGVEFAEPNYLVSIADTVPNDSRFNELWGLHNTGQTGGVADADIDAIEAWDIQTGSYESVVGVIDTGIDYRHPDLYQNIWLNQNEIPPAIAPLLNDAIPDGIITFADLNDPSNWNPSGPNGVVSDWNNNGYIDAGDLLADPTWEDGIDNDNNGYVDDFVGWDFLNNDNDPFDDNSHGTHVSGTIAATGNNGSGVVGVNWQARLIGLKFLDAGGRGNTEDAVGAVEYATAVGANMTSNSWGGGGSSQSMINAITAADQADALFVAAAGNSSQDNDFTASYPANYDVPNVISVAATDASDQYASFTSFGATTVDLSAPGVGVLSTVPNGGYAAFNGTSMATPHVAGAAALIWAQDPSLSNDFVKSLILDSVDPITPDRKSTLTNGRLNIFTALSVFEDDQIAPAAIDDLIVTDVTRTSAQLAWTATGDDGYEGLARHYDIRYSRSPLDSQAAWDNAIRVQDPPRPSSPGTLETLTIDGLFHSSVYYFGIQVFDNVSNASDLSNIAQGNTLLATEILTDDFEDGSGNWTASGLWHQSSNRFRTPSMAWYYGRQDERNYDTGTRNSGSLTTPELDLTLVEDAFLQFSEWSQVESFQSYDRTRVQISNNGSTWTDIWESHGTGNRWGVRNVDLSTYVGQTVQIRFFFDTGDTAQNHFEGWYVEDISVYASTPGPGIRVSPTGGLITSEDGTSATFSVQMTSQPASDVTISLDLDAAGLSEGQLDQSELIFTPDNWLEPRIVTVTGIQDPVGEKDYEDISYNVVTGAAVSADPVYDGMEVLDVGVTNLNTDVRPAVFVSPTEGLVTTEDPSGAPATFEVVLSTAPAPGAIVTIDLNSSDTSEGSLVGAVNNTLTLEFNETNWNSPQTVTVQGLPDPGLGDKDFEDIAYQIITSNTSSSGDPEFDNLAVSDVSLTNLNVDVRPDVIVTPTTGLRTTEDGGTATFTVVLTSPPLENVRVFVESYDDTEGQIAPLSLNFGPSTWDAEQTVTVTGIPDTGELDFEDIEYTIVLSMDSSDFEYGAIDPPDVVVVNENTDVPPEIRVTPTGGLTTDEDGGTASFEVVLSTAPEPDVIVEIGIESQDASEGTVSTSALTFDASNWDTPQTVVVTGIDDPESDDLLDGDINYAITTTNLTESPSKYAGLSVSDVSVTNIDKDVPPFLFEHGVVTVSNAGTVVSLDYDYSSPVIVATPNYGQGVNPGVVRLDNVGGNSFELKVVTPGGAPMDGVSVHYVVVEEGNYDLPGGLKMEAYSFESTLVDYKNSWVGQERTYVNSYTSPVVMGQVMTSNDPDWSVFWNSSVDSRTNPPSSSGFKVGLHVGEDPDITRVAETIGYIVIESGAGEIDGLAFEAGVGGDTVSGYQNSPPYTYTLNTLTDPETAVVGLTAMDGNDGGWAILHGDNAVGERTIELAIDEDQLSNSERSHTFEQVAYLVLKDVGPPLPMVSIGDATVTEGNTGEVAVEFTVTLSESPTSTVSVNFATADATAVAPGDYTELTGTLTFEANTTELSQTVTVMVQGDELDEIDEAFNVVLTSATNANIAAGTGTGTIVDDDAAPELQVSHLLLTEGNSGTTEANFAVTLSALSGKDVSFSYSTGDGTAVAGEDYNAASGQVVIPAGQMSGTITVLVNGDTKDEDNESFMVNLSAPVNATLANSSVIGTIMNDDQAPTISIGGAEVLEGQSGTSALEFPVQLSEISGKDITVEYSTADGTATAGEDYLSAAGVLTIPAGQASGTIVVTVNGDTDEEETENLTATLASPYNATLGASTATGLIINDDFPPSEANLQVLTTNSGSGWTTVTLSNNYNSMVVIGTPNYDSSTAASVVRVQAAEGNSFEFYVQSTANGQAISDIPVHFLVIEEGVYENVGGVAMEAVKYESTTTQGWGAWQTQTRDYQNSYTNPVVVGQVMTTNDADWSVFWSSSSARNSPATSTSFSVGKHIGEDLDTTRANETIGYLVLEAGSSTEGSLSFSSAVGADTVRGVGNNPAYSYANPQPNSSIVIASAAGMDGNNGGWPILYGDSPVGSNINFAFDEDQSWDAERRHTTEQVAFIAFALPGSGNSLTIDADPVDSPVSDLPSNEFPLYTLDFTPQVFDSINERMIQAELILERTGITTGADLPARYGPTSLLDAPFADFARDFDAADLQGPRDPAIEGALNEIVDELLGELGKQL